MRLARATVLALLLGPFAAARAEEFTVATYNVENWREHFQAKALATTQPALDPNLLRRLQKEDDEDNWEVATVFRDPAFNPDILVFQEGPSQQQLEEFNQRWLEGAYETVLVFPSNSGRGQTIGIMLKPGFKVLERRDQYYLEPDTVPNPRGERLFARGPAFALVQTPGGYKLWVGTNHQKSKSGNNVDVTRWRNREAARTNEIIHDLSRSSGTDDVLFLGDMNDELHYQEFEQEAGGDTMALLAGTGDRRLIVATEKLSETGAITFGGYWDNRRRSFIDHVLATPSMKDQLADPAVITSGLAPAASDHYPVIIRVKSDPPR
jgi:endonuclease/exonuclease/phosphatase family metal-dependent hydrolase